MASKRKGAYRMTPKRRAALKKAQMISAKKRRGSKFKSALRTSAAIGSAIGATFVTYHANNYIVRPDIAVAHGRAAGRGTANLVRAGARRVRRGGNQKPPNVIRRQPTDWSKFGYL